MPREHTPAAVTARTRRFADDRMLEALGVAACLADATQPDLPLTYVNPAFERLTGFSREEALGRNCRFLQGPDADPRAVEDMREALARGEACQVTVRNRRRNGDGFWNQVTITPVHEDERLVAWVGALAEVPGPFDAITGLPDRAELDDRLRAAVARARRRGRAVALLFIDLDNFKLVNDSLGHAAGDRLLRRVALRLAGVEQGRGGVLARRGGDEFLILLDDLHPEQAEAVARATAEDVATRLAEPFRIAGAEFHVEASTGISVFPGDADGAHSLLQHADVAMYQSKGRGRAASTVYARMSHDPLERLSLSSRLRRAIAGDELQLHYQPIVWTASGRLHSMEALLRWNDPDRGLVHPDAFIPAAEEMSLLEPIGEWVVGELARQVREWDAMGLAARVSFNVSPRQLHRPDFALELAERLRTEGVDASRLTMELTESATLREPERIGPLLRDLRATGLQLAIDDFGAGWSSLSRLRQLPVQTLKIDRSFLREIPDDPEAGAIVRAVIALSDALGMTTVAEGVEQPVQQHFLAAQGCPLAQGLLFGDAVPAAEMTARLQAQPG